MNKEFFEALSILEKENGIPFDFMIDKIQKALVTAVKKNNDNEDIIVNVDAKTSQFEVFLRKEVVADDYEDIGEFNPNRQIFFSEAKKKDRSVNIGDKVSVRLETKQFSRSAAQAAKQVIRQCIREAEHSQTVKTFQSRNLEVVSAVVDRIEPDGAAMLVIGKNEVMLSASEQIGFDGLKPGDHIKVLIEARESEKGTRIIISRTRSEMVKRLFEMEVPEIFDGTVEIKAISREAGFRSKIAVFSKDENVDAVGACIGPHGSRVGKIVEELRGEKIDIVEYSEDPAKFIAAALAPASVTKVELNADGSKGCHVAVPDSQLSLAIGNKGQNARLAAHLTGWKIDIRAESAFVSENAVAQETAEEPESTEA